MGRPIDIQKPMDMSHIKSIDDYDARIKELEQYALVLDAQHRVISKEKELGIRKELKTPAWSKLMMAVIFGICIEIIIYAECVMWFHYDLSALYALIGVPAAMAATFWSYAEKSKVENSKGGITYDTAMKKLEMIDPPPQDNRDGAEGVG